MAERTASRLRRALILSVPLTALLAADLVTSTPAAAQDRPRNVLEMLFGPPIERAEPRQQRRQAAPPAQTRSREVRRQRQQPRRSASQPSRSNRQSTSRKARPAAVAPPVAAAVAKSETARDVLVVGDFLAGSLARGLTDSLASNRDVEIVAKANGSSGLVRQDYYDWIGQMPELVRETEADVVVVMLGSNDRQGIGSNAVRSEEWTQQYTQRTVALAEAVKAAGVPLVWVGTPAFQSPRMSEDMVFFNDLYKRAATSVGGEFVDIWGGFTDAAGAYTASGPDPAGQPARLRNSDGITMASAGTAKLAYYAEKPVLRALGLSVDDLLMSLAPQQLPQSDLPTIATPDVAVAAIIETKPVSLTDPSLDGGDQLLGGAPVPVAPTESPRDRLVLSGLAAEAMDGRADAFNWTGKGGAVSPVTQNNAIVSRGSIRLEDLQNAGASAQPVAPPAADAASGTD